MNKPISLDLAKFLDGKELLESIPTESQAGWHILAIDHSENYKKGLPVDESKVFYTANQQEYDNKTEIDEETYHNTYHVFSAPTMADVVMWLYREYGIWVEVRHNLISEQFFFEIIMNEGETHHNNDKLLFSSPTEAYEAAIEKCLNDLI